MQLQNHNILNINTLIRFYFQRNTIGIMMWKHRNGLKDFKQNRQAQKIKKQRPGNSEMAEAISYALSGFLNHFHLWCYHQSAGT